MFFLHFQFSQLKDTVKQKHITISIKKKIANIQPYSPLK